MIVCGVWLLSSISILISIPMLMLIFLFEYCFVLVLFLFIVYRSNDRSIDFIVYRSDNRSIEQSISEKSKFCNRLICIFHVSKSTGGGTYSMFCGSRGDDNLETTLLSRGGCPELILRLITPGVIYMRPRVPHLGYRSTYFYKGFGHLVGKHFL